MYCKKCGKELLDEALVCPNCGCETDNYKGEATVAVSTNPTQYIQRIVKSVGAESKNMYRMRLSAAILFLIVALLSIYMLYDKLSSNSATLHYALSSIFSKHIIIISISYAISFVFSSVIGLLLLIKQHKSALSFISCFFCICVICFGYLSLPDITSNPFANRAHSILYIGILVILAIMAWLVKRNILKNKYLPYAISLTNIIFLVVYVLEVFSRWKYSYYNVDPFIEILFDDFYSMFPIFAMAVIATVAMSLVCHYHISANKYKKELT